MRGRKGKQKVGQEVFLAAWCHKYLLHSQQYSTAALPTMNQVTPCSLHSFLITVQYTVCLPLSLCLSLSLSLSAHLLMQKRNRSYLHAVCSVLHLLFHRPVNVCFLVTHTSCSVTFIVSLTLSFTYIAIHQNVYIQYSPNIHGSWSFSE